MSDPIDWKLFQQCPTCFAELGKPCWELTGWYGGVVTVEAAVPHTGRKLRAAAAREEASRG